MSFDNKNEEIKTETIETNTPILVKKRGRKPKNRDNIVSEKNLTENSKKSQVSIQPQIKKIPVMSKIENTILFFPIKSDSTEIIKKNNIFPTMNFKNNVDTFQYSNTKNESLLYDSNSDNQSYDPHPYDPNINLNMHFDFQEPLNISNSQSISNEVSNFEDLRKTLQSSANPKNNGNYEDYFKNFSFNKDNRESETTSTHSFAYVFNDTNKNKNLNLNALNKNIRVIPILSEFIKCNENKKMPENTKTCCYWDTEPFDWEPLGLPERKIGNTFYVKHCFCSYSCMASYNFRINDDKVWERYALINLMYKLQYNLNQNIKVKLAPPIEALEKFGGIYNIDDFRKLSEIKQVKIQSFPLINIQSYLEEINIQLNDNQSSNSISQTDVKNYLDKVNNDYKSSKNKYGGSKNTLEFCMGLKKVN